MRCTNVQPPAKEATALTSASACRSRFQLFGLRAACNGPSALKTLCSCLAIHVPLQIGWQFTTFAPALLVPYMLLLVRYAKTAAGKLFGSTAASILLAPRLACLCHSMRARLSRWVSGLMRGHNQLLRPALSFAAVCSAMRRAFSSGASSWR